jgi:hypothetical protein
LPETNVFEAALLFRNSGGAARRIASIGGFRLQGFGADLIQQKFLRRRPGASGRWPRAARSGTMGRDSSAKMIAQRLRSLPRLCVPAMASAASAAGSSASARKRLTHAIALRAFDAEDAGCSRRRGLRALPRARSPGFRDLRLESRIALSRSRSAAESEPTCSMARTTVSARTALSLSPSKLDEMSAAALALEQAAALHQRQRAGRAQRSGGVGSAAVGGFELDVLHAAEEDCPHPDARTLASVRLMAFFAQHCGSDLTGSSLPERSMKRSKAVSSSGVS